MHARVKRGAAKLQDQNFYQGEKVSSKRRGLRGPKQKKKEEGSPSEKRGKQAVGWWYKKAGEVYIKGGSAETNV